MIPKFLYSLLIIPLLLFQSESQHYKANSDVNLRNGPSTSYQVLDVLKIGDTIELIEESNTSWAKIKFNGNEGYSSLRFFEKVTIPTEEVNNSSSIDAVDREEEDYISKFWIQWLAIGGLLSLLIFYLGKRKRNRTAAVLLSLFTGFMGLQKFYLGKFWQGLFCLVFFWTLIPFLIGLYDMAKLSFMDEEKFQLMYNNIISDFRKEGLKEETINKKRNFASENFENTSMSSNEDIGAEPSAQNKRSSKKVINSDTNYPSFRYPPNSINSNPIYSENESQEILNKDDSSFFDDSIIDISEEAIDTQIPEQQTEGETPATKNNISQDFNDVPYWRQFYVYSYKDILLASEAQKKYYKYFRNKILEGIKIDIDGNTNYAFILYFDLLQDYENHRDVVTLEKQFKLLGECCSKTRSYSLYSLIDVLKERNDEYSKKKLEKLQDPYSRYELGFSDYDPYSYRLGRRYKEKLQLTEKQETWLNKFHNPSNVFNSIEGCCIAIIQLYLKVLGNLDEKLKIEGRDLNTEVTALKEQVKTQSSPYKNVYDFNFMEERVQEEIFLTFFKRTENVVRKKFHHKRKISEEFSITEKKLNIQFEENLGESFNQILNEKDNSIATPDLPTQIELNEQNVNRWKIEFKEISSYLIAKEKNNFIQKIGDLETANQKNPNIENIFFESSKAIAKFDRTKALEYYVKYINYDLNSDKIHNKKLTKTVQKSLFRNQEELINFEKIIQNLIDNRNLTNALNEIKDFYKPKRRRIVLNQKEIEDVKNKHNKTVSILSGYLEDEEKEIQKINDSEEVELSFTKVTASHTSLFLEDLNLNPFHEEMLTRIASNSFSIEQKTVEEMALEKGQLKNQLIDDINEICSEILEGEFLIEEDEDYYIMEESFYKDLIKKQ
ncbi:tellurite resistance TerB C-terminal domain-containing protein [Salegentibacter sp. Hel_I_6]|uniref:tellurite resistance TerB C-terminal domain-containing protein n=1 Tax=Salegentibacter sp. Hel_I_6 TaxID=1250278 RepID=UPI00068D27AC|nr:tellurite resistance TerB C-terminal domain-containing protein [Salegentibacter sp. Hel_I_6]